MDDGKTRRRQQEPTQEQLQTAGCRGKFCLVQNRSTGTGTGTGTGTSGTGNTPTADTRTPPRVTASKGLKAAVAPVQAGAAQAGEEDSPRPPPLETWTATKDRSRQSQPGLTPEGREMIAAGGERNRRGNEGAGPASGDRWKL